MLHDVMTSHRKPQRLYMVYYGRSQQKPGNHVFNLMTLFSFEYYAFGAFTDCGHMSAWLATKLHTTHLALQAAQRVYTTDQLVYVCMRSRVPKVCGSILLQPSHLWPRVSTQEEPCIYIPNCARTTIFGAYETRHFWRMSDSNSWRTYWLLARLSTLKLPPFWGWSVFEILDHRENCIFEAHYMCWLVTSPTLYGPLRHDWLDLCAMNLAFKLVRSIDPEVPHTKSI